MFSPSKAVLFPLSLCLVLGPVFQSHARMQWQISMKEGPENLVYQLFCDNGTQLFQLRIGQIILEDGRIGPFRSALLRRPVLRNVHIILASTQNLTYLESFFQELGADFVFKCYEITVDVGELRYVADVATLSLNKIDLIEGAKKVNKAKLTSKRISRLTITNDSLD